MKTLVRICLLITLSLIYSFASAQARLSEQETIFSAMELLQHWIKRYGIPLALYTDKKNVYVVDEQTRQSRAHHMLDGIPHAGPRAGVRFG